MPLIGAGTQFGFSEDGNHRGRVEDASTHIAHALKAGFRLLDTARGYGTEPYVMHGIEASGLERRDVFVVSKGWPGIDHDPGLASSRAAIAESAARLGGYVDLFLVHHPVTGWQDLWRALEEAKDEGAVRTIGVSNFGLEHFEELQTFARYRPVVNQIHLHPFIYGHSTDLVRICQLHSITIMAFPRCPWTSGEGTAVDSIAASCDRTRAQVMLRWAVDHGFAVIPLSTDQQHLAENFAIREFQLSPEQVQEIDQLGQRRNLRYHIDHLDHQSVRGWAFAEGGLERIRVLVDGVSVGEATRGISRPDVQQAHPDQAPALLSGFALQFPDGSMERGPHRIDLSFELSNGEQVEAETVVWSRT